MQLLNPVSENLLQFLCDNTSIGERNNADIVFEAFKNRYSRNDIIAELECLSNQGYIKAMFDDSYEIGYIILHSNGISYFRDKQCRSESYSPSVIINNSTGFNVGNNNSNSININDNISFDDVYKLVDSLNSSNKEELREIVDCLRLGRDGLAAMLDQARTLLAAALLAQYGQSPEGPDAALIVQLGKRLTKQRIMGTIELLQTYRGACSYNVGASHVLGALAVELEEIL